MVPLMVNTMFTASIFYEESDTPKGREIYLFLSALGTTKKLLKWIWMGILAFVGLS